MSNEKAAPEMNVELANYQTRLWEALGEPNTFNFISAVKALTAEVAALKAEIARRDAPVTDAEWIEFAKPHHHNGRVPTAQAIVNCVILARATPPHDGGKE